MQQPTGETQAPLTAETLRRVVDAANLPALLMVLFQVTGDQRWLAEPYRPTRSRGLTDHDDGGFSPSIQVEIREAGIDALQRLQQGVECAVPMPTPAEVVRMLAACVGETVDIEHGPMFAEELARLAPMSGHDPSVSTTPPEGFRAIIIGAGVSGIIAAHQLGRLGIPYTIIDRHAAAGGNWLDNPYPGAGVDTPSHLYTFTFAPHDWVKHFELREQLQPYFRRVFEQVGASEHALFETEVVSAEFEETRQEWRVSTVDPKGVTRELTANILISAVGILNRSKMPPVPGLEDFGGQSFHSSAWPDELDLTGRTVAVVGTGASAMQIVPAITDRVDKVVVFQRTPAWIAPFEKFQQPIDPHARILLDRFPLYRAWYRLKLYWQFGDKVLDALRVDPSWPHPARAVNAINDGHRQYFTKYIEKELDGRPELLPAVVPDYPPYGKRILLDNGWYAALRRDNVQIVGDGVERIEGNAIVTTSGDQFPVDIIVWATGFQATRFVSSYDVRGLDGVSLREVWDDDDAKAFLGTTVPGFPNLFLLGGPNSFPGSGSFMSSMEVQMRYVARLIEEMFADAVSTAEVRRDVFDEYNEAVDATSEGTVWTHPGMETYYRNSRGRVVVVSPFRNVDFWVRANASGLHDYVTQR